MPTVRKKKKMQEIKIIEVRKQWEIEKCSLANKQCFWRLWWV